ncbi:MAG: AAA family ATPase, partial [Polyangiaceae bacterium]|nr:AAA family ATPase [Polyangiaceae bacterium]
MPGSRLTSIALEGFKGFERARVDLGGFTVVVGTNASGKSNLAEAFRFLHGIARGYSLEDIIDEKWSKAGELLWPGLRGATRDVAFAGLGSFAVEIGVSVDDGGKVDEYLYRVEVDVTDVGAAAFKSEKLLIGVDRDIVFAMDSSIDVPTVSQLFRFIQVRLGPGGLSNPASIHLVHDWACLHQLASLSAGIRGLDSASLSQINNYYYRLLPIIAQCKAVISAMASIRFLDLVPDAMKRPSVPGRRVLGVYGEHLSSVLQEICANPEKKAAIHEWLSELAPLAIV